MKPYLDWEAIFHAYFRLMARNHRHSHRQKRFVEFRWIGELDGDCYDRMK